MESISLSLNKKSAPLVVVSTLYDLILQCKGELQTETVQVVDAGALSPLHPWRCASGWGAGWLCSGAI